MKPASTSFLWLLFRLTALASAQAVSLVPDSAGDKGANQYNTSDGSLSPGFALQAFERRSSLQAGQLRSYSTTISIRVQLPDISEYGEYDLQKRYSAPRTLVFKALHFTGDYFIIRSVIVRLLESEVEHLRKDDPALTAITSANYKFSYNRVSGLEGRSIYVYELKPRHKRWGLFKGRIYLDAYSGCLTRAEGRLVKSSSLFVRNVDFTEDFAEIDSFTLPVHIHSEAQARLVGRSIVDIYQDDYQSVATRPEDPSDAPF
jgi:hypothetical protein